MNVSVVMPYWKRPEALIASIAMYRRHYGNALDVVVVNDGSDDLPLLSGVTLVDLPAKDRALNPCVALNAGVRAARGDVIMLTNPEVMHRAPIIDGLIEELGRLGPLGYVSAACWSPKHGFWFVHSTATPRPEAIGRAPVPPGAALHFCAVLHRSLFDAVGGFSEEYRDGQGYEDNDFLWKLAGAGARFAIRDDLVTEHIDCPPSHWPPGGLARNRAIFEAKRQEHWR